MTTTADKVRDLAASLVADLGASVYDVEQAGAVLRISLERPEGLDMSVLTEATRRISAELDSVDLVPGPYTLEVSSPGLERPLRTPAHFAGAVGERVKVKTRPGVEGDRRVEGRLTAASGESVTVTTDDGAERVLGLGDIERANTHVDWSPPPKPGSKGSSRAKGAGQGRSAQPSDTQPSTTQPSTTPPSTTENEATS